MSGLGAADDGTDDLMGNGACGAEDDEDYLDVRTKDILVLHLPELKVSEK